MATKSSTKTAKKAAKTKQDLLYIMSPTCGWCKKADPVVDELIKDGAKITKLDVTNPDDQKRANDVKQKFSAQCGTPLFIDGESGNMKCGFAEKDVLEKWVAGEEIPKPPQPKSPPPPPPTDFQDQGQVNTFKEAYEKWAKENDHLPRILPVDQVLQRMEQAQQQRAAQGGQGPQAGPPTQQPTPTPAPQGNVNTGDGSGNVIVDNRLQILESKQNILEAKLDQIINSIGNNAPTAAPTRPTAPTAQGPQAGPPTGKPTPSKQKLEEVRAEAAKKRAQLENKSKANTKTVKGL